MRQIFALLFVLVLFAAPVPTRAGDATVTAPVKPATAKLEPLDINSASELQLKALPGIGEAYAKKIVAGRPYAKKDQLKSRGILPAAAYDKIQARIIASQPGK